MRSDALARRNRIIEAACEMFASQPNSVALDVIAEHAGVGIATLYRNFPDRNALIHACGARYFTNAIEFQREVIANFEQDPQSWWYRYADRLIEMGVSTLVSSFAPDDLNTLPEDVREMRETTEALGKQIIDAAKKAGLVHPALTHLDFIIGLITVARPPVPGVLSLEPNITANLVEIFLAGLKAGPARPERYSASTVEPTTT